VSTKLEYEITPGVSIRVFGFLPPRQIDVGRRLWWKGPFTRGASWLVGLSADQRDEFTRLACDHDAPFGVVSDWMQDHDFPDWEPATEDDHLTFKWSEWAVELIREYVDVPFDRTWKIGDKANWGWSYGMDGIVQKIGKKSLSILPNNPTYRSRGTGSRIVRISSFIDYNDSPPMKSYNEWARMLGVSR